MGCFNETAFTVPLILIYLFFFASFLCVVTFPLYSLAPSALLPTNNFLGLRFIGLNGSAMSICDGLID